MIISPATSYKKATQALNFVASIKDIPAEDTEIKAYIQTHPIVVKQEKLNLGPSLYCQEENVH